MFFFFSSRRRHTRCSRDWSSDVCSSDLVGDRAIVQGRIDAENRGLLPGDTLRLYVEALDNAPTPHTGRSAEVALRLPSMEELRAEARAAARAAATAANSVSAAQRELSDRTRDLAQERSRDCDCEIGRAHV